MSAEENKALVSRSFEERNKGKIFIDVMDKFYATDWVGHGSTGPDIRGLENYKQHTSEVYDAFPDRHLTIDDMVAEGDKVVVRWTSTATHKGAYMGIPPTNKKLTGWAIEIFRIVDGKFAEAWLRSDTLGGMQQLGIIPTSKKE